MEVMNFKQNNTSNDSSSTNNNQNNNSKNNNKFIGYIATAYIQGLGESFKNNCFKYGI